MLPVPGLVGKLAHKIQEERLKRSDARVQSVTESGLVSSYDIYHANDFSHECIAHGEALWVGEEDGRQDVQ